MPVVVCCVKIEIPTKLRSAEERKERGADKAKIIVVDRNSFQELDAFDMRIYDTDDFKNMARVTRNFRGACRDAELLILKDGVLTHIDSDPLQRRIDFDAIRDHYSKVQREYADVWRDFFGPPWFESSHVPLSFGLFETKKDYQDDWRDPFQRRRFSPEIRALLYKIHCWPPRLKLSRRAANWQRTRAQTTREHMRCGRFDWE